MLTGRTEHDYRNRPFAGQIVLIDGRSGAGKTTIAKQIAAQNNAQLVQLDELYPGWEGLRAGVQLAISEVILQCRVPQFNWQTMRFGIPRTLNRQQRLVLEGCGVLTPDLISAARRTGARVITIWVECDEAERKARALARDGVSYENRWETWAAQEQQHIADHNPQQLAQKIYTTDGAGGDFGIVC